MKTLPAPAGADGRGVADGAPAVEAPVLDPVRLEELEPFRALLERLVERRRASAGNLWGSAQAWLAAGLARRFPGPLLCVLSSEAEADSFADDLAAFGADALLLPARERGRRGAGADPESVRLRLQAAQRLGGPAERRPRLVVASLLSLLQPVPSPGDLEGDFLHLQRRQRLLAEDLLERLIGAGYTRQPLAEAPGEVSLRGDILDVFPYAADGPLRIELFDDAIESIRSFDPETQLSIETHERIAVCIASDAGGVEDGRGASPMELFSASGLVVDVEPLRIHEQAEGLRIRSSSHARALEELGRARAERHHLELQSLPARDLDFANRTVQGLAVGIQRAPAELAAIAEAGDRVTVLCRTEAERERFAGLLGEAGAPASVLLRLGSVAKGFRFPATRDVLVNHRELVGILGARGARRTKATHKTRVLKSFFELRRGDLVVHAAHGLGRYLGLERVERGGGVEEHMHLRFADDVSLYVPASRIDLVQRYVGGGSAAPQLDKIGGQAFRKRKERVERALQDLSASLLEIQAQRELVKREPWPDDDAIVRQMLDAFPYAPTTDQVEIDREIRADLSGPRPMDRLLCGDVGFGKTELAIRAAFRVVNGGAQVAVLVPTTVLADQHHATFSERLADFPVRVGVLSRTVRGKAAAETLAGVANGSVDVLVGTHRILSKDVRFANLGLIVIDEEQRFGVAHKEHFKLFRANTDVLTLSATPIPRTLHMSLSGVRDISALTVPPEGRQDVGTTILRADHRETVREAILLEKQRGGQVFYLHNRVRSIERVARELRALVPECAFAVGHGQMPARMLSEVMRSFIHAEVDVLVATTIVENGIDIPSAGTMFIDRADAFGLSELHQLRGRVGRGRHKSHCYLLVDEERPLPDVAKERLKAIEELSQLGAGFGISMKDLEIRGAGNILGPEQSGHIASVGYDMYCRLLRKTVERMAAGAGRAPVAEETQRGERGAADPSEVELELGLAAYLPAEWIPSEDTRLEVLRALDAIRTDEDAGEAEARLRDRFGRPPAEAVALLRQFRLRPHLARAGVRRLAWRGETYLVEYADRVLLEAALAAAGATPELRPLRAGQAHLVIPGGGTAEQALAWIERTLSGTPVEPKMPDASPERSAR